MRANDRGGPGVPAPDTMPAGDDRWDDADEAGAPAMRASRRSPVLTWGLVGLCLLAAVLRLINLWSDVPLLVGPDEPVVFDRAQLLLRGEVPDRYDWPTGSMVYLAAVLQLVGWLTPVGVEDAGAGYRVARLAFAALSPVLVLATAALARELVRGKRRDGVGAFAVLFPAALVAVAYPLVRAGRALSPDILQALAATAGLWLLVTFDRRRSNGLLFAAGCAAGVAFGTKYVGGALLLPIAASIAWHRSDVGEKLRQAGVAVGGFVVAAVMTLPAVLLDFDEVRRGVTFQATHQSAGHFGYDGPSRALGFHVFEALPGAWGWMATVMTLGALVWALVAGGRGARLVALFAAVCLVALGASTVRFPHYVIVYLPALAALGGALFAELRVRVGVRGAQLAAVALGLSLLPTVAHDVRLLRAVGAPNTRALASPVVAQLDGDIVAEAYTDLTAKGRRVGAIGADPGVLSCGGCYVVTSSYQEDRFRREPARYAGELAVYDELRATAEVVARFSPTPPLSYRWDTLPRYGVDALPLTGEVGPVGPEITIYRRDGGGRGGT